MSEPRNGNGFLRQVTGWFNDWSLPRQLAGQPALSTAAESEGSRKARPRLEMADTVGTSICPYCAVGCAQLMYAKDNQVIHVEGDPRSPVNQGTLCPKGSATLGMLHSPLRLTTVKYRAPYSDRWEEKPLDWAMERIAQTIRGLFIFGQNPVVGHHHAGLFTKGLANLEWLVVREAFENETAAFWYSSPEVRAGELKTREIGTEVFLLPASVVGEKEGTFTNTHRLVQWHDKVVDPPGDCRSEHWFVYHLGRRLKELYADESGPAAEQIRALTWDYPTEGEHAEPKAEEILKEINGYTWPGRDQIPDAGELRDDGSTACGCWIYCGAYPRNDFNQTRSRVPDGPDGPGTHHGWAYSWPGNRRTLYNRASADADGNPWSEAKKYLWWDAVEQRWVGPDRPDFPPDKPPDDEPNRAARPRGMDALDGRSPFPLNADGKAALFVPSGLKDGPLPCHYEPAESPVENPLYDGVSDNPAAKKFERDDNPHHPVGDPRYPYVLTTYRLTEHHCGGMMTRAVPSTSELQPEGFCEIAPEMARELGIRNLDWVVISTARAEIETRALVTERVVPLTVDGRRVYQVGLPWHFGWLGFATGGVANRLTNVALDPNCMIPESKVLTCGLRKGRLGEPRNAESGTRNGKPGA
jgi:formate dehydrogenase major subunit